MSQSDTSEAPPAKRQRMDGAEELTRSDIWHDDGSVVLQVESTLFRVHWSVISLHSPFFRDMRDLPQPADQPSIEGCPVVVLHDSSEDVQYFLHALYNPFVRSVGLDVTVAENVAADTFSTRRNFHFRSLRQSSEWDANTTSKTFWRRRCSVSLMKVQQPSSNTKP